MDRFKHIIQKQNVEVVFSSGGNAFTCKDQLSDLCMTKLAEEIEKLFDLKVPKNKILRADKIIIDAGELPETNWQSLFIERVIEQLTDCINNVAVFSSNVHPINSLGKNDEMDSQGDSAELQEISSSEHISRSILHFFESGLLPWYSSINSRSDLNERFIRLVNDDHFFIQLIKILKTNDQAFERVVYQLNESALQSIIQNVGFETDLVRSLKGFLEEVFSRLKLAPNNKRHMAYRIMLRSALDHDNRLSKKVNWHEYVDAVLSFTFKRFVTAGVDRIISMLNEPAFVAFRERSLISLNGLRDMKDGDEMPDKVSTSKPSFITAKVKSDPQRDTVYIANAGLVLLHPFLPMLFENVGYFYNKAWASTNHQQRAVLLTQYLVTGNEEYPEFDLLLNKIVTGYPIAESLPSEIALSDFEKQEAMDVLHSVIRHWSALKNISIEGLQSSFLMREGKLSKNDSDWWLHVDHKTIDILLNRIPWGFSIIKTPWMKTKLVVEWNS
jgi:hypothetical protein